jgi:hypothetical protein
MAQPSPRPSPEQRIRAALWFAERGFGIFSVWSTFPGGRCRCPKGVDCTSPGKHPIGVNGFKDATRDPERIRTLLLAGSEPNYGLVCPDGVFALDVDTDEELRRIADLSERYGDLPETLTTKTAHGQHLFYRWPDGYPRPIRKLFGFVTRWGTGRLQGYVIGPRSVHASGYEYEPVSGTLEIATLPEQWAAAGVADAPAAAITIIGDQLPSVGGRHDWLRNRARALRGVINDPAVLRVAVLAENDRLEQPKSAEEVDRAIGEVFEKFGPDTVEEVEDRSSRRIGDDELDLLGVSRSEAFPDDLPAIAYEGLVGRMVYDLAAGTDAGHVGLLGAVLAFCGALLPGMAYFHRTQTSSPFIALVGESTFGRKGTTMMRAQDAFTKAFGTMAVNGVLLDGINSGEGLVTHLAARKGYGPITALLLEEEYANNLASRGREGSTLDPKMRLAFDGGQLSNRKVGDSKVVDPPYWLPALIGITPKELRNMIGLSAMTNGSANRWLYLPVVKRKAPALNTPPEFTEETRQELDKARDSYKLQPPTLSVDPAVRDRLSEYADFLPTVSYGLASDLTRRYQVIALRIALIHALADRSSTVESKHLDRALALTEYARQGIGWVFGDTIGDAYANLLYRQLVEEGELTQNRITRGVIRDPIKRQAAVDELLRIGKAEIVTVSGTGGRSRKLLRPTPGSGAFVHFVHSSAIRHGETVDERVFMDESVQTGWTKAGEKVDERWTKAPNDPPLTENSVTSNGASVTCHFYVEHQTQHRWNGSRWVCPVCDPDPEAG